VEEGTSFAGDYLEGLACQISTSYDTGVFCKLITRRELITRACVGQKLELSEIGYNMAESPNPLSTHPVPGKVVTHEGGHLTQWLALLFSIGKVGGSIPS